MRPGVDTAFSVTVSKDYLAFSSAHFITFAGHQCESLHGHNYRVGVTVHGAVDPECAFVVDFSILKEIVRALVKPWDHRVLLPTLSEKLVFREDAEHLLVDYLGRRRFLFPRSDCALIPISNTTAEMLAELLARQVRDAFIERGVMNLTAIEIEVEESPGQAAIYRIASASD